MTHFDRSCNIKSYYNTAGIYQANNKDTRTTPHMPEAEIMNETKNVKEAPYMKETLYVLKLSENSIKIMFAR